jgi:hypothetical protein
MKSAASFHEEGKMIEDAVSDAVSCVTELLPGVDISDSAFYTPSFPVHPKLPIFFSFSFLYAIKPCKTIPYHNVNLHFFPSNFFTCIDHSLLGLGGDPTNRFCFGFVQ